MTWNDGAMPRYCHQACCNEPDTEEDVMSEDTLVERLNGYAIKVYDPQLAVALRSAAARLTAQAEEIGRLRGLLAEADTIEQSVVSDAERADFWTRLRAELDRTQP